MAEETEGQQSNITSAVSYSDEEQLNLNPSLTASPMLYHLNKYITKVLYQLRKNWKIEKTICNLIILS